MKETIEKLKEDLALAKQIRNAWLDENCILSTVGREDFYFYEGKIQGIMDAIDIVEEEND